ncbi:MAG: hypothetical protein N2C14_17995, partial [Planctomycetales bacterium]
MSNVPDKPTGKRRWLRFSLRRLFAIMIAASVAFGWFGAHWRAKQQERAAVDALREIGGTIAYDYQLGGTTVYDFPFFTTSTYCFGPPPPPGPSWLRSILGDDWFANVEYVNLEYTEIGDEC